MENLWLNRQQSRNNPKPPKSQNPQRMPNQIKIDLVRPVRHHMMRKQSEESTNKITASNFFFLLLLISNRKIYA
jgi:hypothetical protein